MLSYLHALNSNVDTVPGCPIFTVALVVPLLHFFFLSSLTCQPAVFLNTNVILHPNDEMCKHLHKPHLLLYPMTMQASI